MNAYRERLLGLLGSEDPLEVLAATPGKIDALLKRIGEPGFDRSVAPGKWTVRQIVGHLTDVEQGIAFRIRQIVTSPEGHVIQPFDQDTWAKPYPRLDPRVGARAHEAMRAWNLTYYRALGAADRARVALHPERGEESVETTLKMHAGHDRNHLAQLEQIAAQGKPA